MTKLPDEPPKSLEDLWWAIAPVLADILARQAEIMRRLEFFNGHVHPYAKPYGEVSAVATLSTGAPQARGAF